MHLACKEFPHRWDTLITELMSFMDQNLQKNSQTLRSLKVLHKITLRYSYSMRSDELYTEIIHVCNHSHDKLLLITSAVL